MDKYVKEIDNNTWEVKLGAGIPPITITRAIVDMHERLSGGTFAAGPGGIEAFVREAHAVAAVNKFLAGKREGDT